MALSVSLTRMQNLRAVVLLAGAVRTRQLHKAIGRSLLDLPVDHGRSVLDEWTQQLTDVSRVYGVSRLPVRVMLDRGSLLPRTMQVADEIELQIEQDPFDLRGTGGLLSDLTRDYDDADWILIASASQILIDPVCEVIEDLAAAEAEVSVACLHDGTPSDLVLLRCGSLREIKRMGFVDFKEQALPEIARNHLVRVVRREGHPGMPIRTRDEYLDALRTYHRARNKDTSQPLLEGWMRIFEVVEAGSQVDESAMIHDSVVLSGGEVQAGAVVVRSIVCDDAVVPAGVPVVDRIIQPDDSIVRKLGFDSL